MATVNSKMTALADEIRELSGTTTSKSIDTMTSDVDAANAEVSSQADLIVQISEALEGKAAGGTGGSGTIETCTVTLNDGGNLRTVICTQFINNTITPLHVEAREIGDQFNNYQLSNVVKGTILSAMTSDSYERCEITGDATLVEVKEGLDFSFYNWLFIINGDCSITIITS